MLGARIAVLRKRAGMSQSSLAKILRVSSSTIGMYEQGRREPSAECIVRLADVFHVSTDYLLTGTLQTAEDAALLQNALKELVKEARQNLRMYRSGSTMAPVADQDLALLLAGLLG